MTSSSLTSKGQTTIPKKIRERLNLRPGDRLEYVVEADGRVLMRPANRDIRELEGLLCREGQAALSVEDMNRIIREKHEGSR